MSLPAATCALPSCGRPIAAGAGRYATEAGPMHTRCYQRRGAVVLCKSCNRRHGRREGCAPAPLPPCESCGAPATQLVPLRDVEVRTDAESGAILSRHHRRRTAPLCASCGPPQT